MLEPHAESCFRAFPIWPGFSAIVRASWTLRADLVSQFVCRLLNHMTEKGAAVVTPQLRAQDQDMPKLPWVDPENFNAGYLMRSMHLMPKEGDREPWIFSQDYQREKTKSRRRPGRWHVVVSIATVVTLPPAIQVPGADVVVSLQNRR